MVSLVLLFKFIFDIGKRLVTDVYFRTLGSLLVTMMLVGSLFFWLVEGQTFGHAFVYSAMTLAMNTPWGIGWGPHTTAGVAFNLVYMYVGVGLYLLFVLEAGKTMIRSYEEFSAKMAERKAKKQALRRAEPAPAMMAVQEPAQRAGDSLNPG